MPLAPVSQRDPVRRVPRLSNLVESPSVLRQQLQHLYRPLARSLMDGCPTVFVGSVRFGAKFEQCCSFVHVSQFGCFAQLGIEVFLGLFCNGRKILNRLRNTEAKPRLRQATNAPILGITAQEWRLAQMENVRARAVDSKVRRNGDVNVPHGPVPHILRRKPMQKDGAVVPASHRAHSSVILLGTLVHETLPGLQFEFVPHSIVVLDLKRPRFIQVMADVHDARNNVCLRLVHV
mmetsp:Transcript_64577/g.107309  ORF Transcript_64577/g.107309 Transcript_64577/m.107309 type:complete len:234 (+) Transcript_64577:247-948(+)